MGVKLMTAEVAACSQVLEILNAGAAESYHASGANLDAAKAQSEQVDEAISSEAVVLLQQSSSRVMSSDSVATMLRNAADKLGSKVLGLAATRVTVMEAAGDGMFDKVNTMIDDLIKKLEA